MNLDQLQATWARQEAALTASLHLNRQILRGLMLERAQRSLRWSAAFTALGALPGFLVIGWLAFFAFEHRHEMRFWIPGVVLQCYAISLMVWTGQSIAARLAVDYSGAVAEIQRQIAHIRRAEMRRTRWVVYTAALIWVPIAIVGAKGLAGADLYVVPGVRWIIWSVIAGIAAAPAFHVLARWIAGRGESKPGFFRSLMRDAGGYNLRQASEVLEELEDLEPHANARTVRT